MLARREYSGFMRTCLCAFVFSFAVCAADWKSDVVFRATFDDSLDTRIADHGGAADLMQRGRRNEAGILYPDFGAVVANSGKIKASAKTKAVWSAQLRLNRRKPARPSQLVSFTCLA